MDPQITLPRAFWACVSFAALVSTGAGQAQVPNTSVTATPAADNGIADIVVTARKREESLQNVPVAITAISGEALKERSIQTFADIQQQTPSLTITPVNADRNSVAVSLRGLTQTDTLLTVDPAVGLYVDGVNVSKTNSTELSSLVDIARVEVLKGPQGTLYGRNTIGGAINISSKLPTDHFEGEVIGRLDSYDRLGGALVLNVPLAPDLAFRAVGQYDHREAFGRDRLLDRGVGGDLDGGNARAALRWSGLAGVEVVLRGDYAKNSTTGFANRPLALTPGSIAERVIRAQGGSADAYLNGTVEGLKFQDSRQDFLPVSDLKVYGGSATVNIDIAADVQFKSISSYRHLTRFLKNDLDGSGYNLLHYTGLTGQRVFTEEDQFGGKLFDNRLNWIMGGFYSRETGSDGTLTYNLGGVNPSRNDGSVNNKSIAAFGQASFDLTEKIGLTGGLRYTKDTKALVSRNRIITPAGTLVSCNVPVIYRDAGTPCQASFKDSWDSVDYLASIDYKPIRGVLLYAKASSGYKAGGFNLRGGIDPLTFAPFQPETVKSYEIGIKSDWLDRRLRINLAAYHSNYDDIQRTVIVPGTLTPTLTVVRNAAKGQIDGAEAEVTAVPIKNLTFTGTLTYIDARYKKYVDGVGRDLSGQAFPFVAKWAYSLSAAYTADLPGGALRGQLDWAWQSRIDEAPDGLFYDSHTVAPYGLMNIRIDKKFLVQRLDIAFYVRNLLDKQYIQTILDTSTSLGLVVGSPGAPRIIGVEITKDF